MRLTEEEYDIILDYQVCVRNIILEFLSGIVDFEKLVGPDAVDACLPNSAKVCKDLEDAQLKLKDIMIEADVI